MNAYIEESTGLWVLVPDDGKLLYNAEENIYTPKLYTQTKGVVATDWVEVDKPITTLTDDELLEQFQSDINSHVTIKRDTKALTDTKVEYSFKYTMTGGCIITETFS